jgi:hypothetical protein
MHACLSRSGIHSEIIPEGAFTGFIGEHVNISDLVSVPLMDRFCAAALMVLLLSGCGLKGPLYLPQESQSTQDKEKKR